MYNQFNSNDNSFYSFSALTVKVDGLNARSAFEKLPAICVSVQSSDFAVLLLGCINS